MDYIIVSGKNEEEHRSRLMNILHRFVKNNVKLNKDKCEWTVSKLIFIDHEFSSTGIRLDLGKVTAITEMAQPKSKQDIEIVTKCNSEIFQVTELLSFIYL